MNDKQQLAAMGEHMAEQSMCMAKRIEALEAQVRALTLPEGWQLVPHMPTPDMCAAFHRADSDWEDGWAFDGNGNRHHSPVYQWVAMLAAAPRPEAK
ncbi:hypothetical protein KE335_gp12 [Aeromonas phage 2_D05]|uniref:Uncharacterized protein n=1 Tax=Aeromonas phage 2_D05 TaxID=2588098 RepID=A0A4Y5TWQ9_9CAUD|nr:hypothetical protein KE335_gp12 [Aeromonas phage 2_D05]QDB73843.1 hypothetical protein 2D05_012 [Aeromonas phage 2_D05]